MFKSGLNSLKKGASSVANKASSVAKDTSQKAEKMGITTENAKKAGLKGGALAKKVVVGAVNSLITPELIAFCKDPTPEKLQANPQIVLPETLSETAFTDSKSPLLAAGNPASITSTLILSSWRAICNFSAQVIDAPGLCSPSRIVVSKIINCSLIVTSTAIFFRS